MRAVMVMFDSLNRRYLSCYGNRRMETPNFDRLSKKTQTFDNFFAGSLPCIPARRDLQTGRMNFLHRSWGPFEPFDESMPELLRQAGIYTHIATDHCHYWEDGGAGYFNRFCSFDLIRGQEADAWAPGPGDTFDGQKFGPAQDRRNRKQMEPEENHSHVKTFRAGERFLTQNKDTDNWFLQLEYFDPHEPFFTPERFRKLYSNPPSPEDWPPYRPAQECGADSVRNYKNNYSAVVSMCDEYLGRVLDLFDRFDLWKDTMLLVNTDHGFMLGEKGFLGKNYMPVYDELANLPFFLWNPQSGKRGERVSALAQTPDIAPTILDYFDVPLGRHMTGKSLLETAETGKPVHDAVIYGYFGMHVNVTDGRYTYMRSAATPDNAPLYQYTLSPWHIRKPFDLNEIKGADRQLFDGFEFTDHTPVLRIPVNEKYDRKKYYRYSGHLRYGSMLFDREKDPEQLHPLDNVEIREQMTEKMVRLMRESEAPQEQYTRLGL